MKKFLFLGALAALLLGTASCSNDMEPQLTDDGTVQFTIELPDAIDSRAISDGLTAKELQIAVYNEAGELMEDISLLKSNDKQVTMTEKQATVTFKLVKGMKYSFAFWAQNPNEDAYTFNPETSDVTVDYEKAVANADDGDAFYNSIKNKTVTGPINQTVTLTRPFAQLNFGDVEADYEAAVDADLDLAQTVVKVSQVATSFNILTKKASTENLVDVTWPAAASLINEDLTVNEVDYKWLSMCYFLVPNNEATVATELTLLNSQENAFNTLVATNVPVKMNYRTNILGNLFTEDAVFNIVIDEKFKSPDKSADFVSGKFITQDNVSSMLKEGTYILVEDINTVRRSWGILATDVITWEMNGHTMTINDSMFGIKTRNKVALTINGPGSFVFTEGTTPGIWQDSSSPMYLNGDILYTTASSNPELIYCYSGTIYISGGTFKKSDANNNTFMLNCYDANYTNGTANIIVTGGKFYNYDPSNSMSEPNGPVSFVAPGYKVVSYADGEDTVYEVVPE